MDEHIVVGHNAIDDGERSEPADLVTLARSLAADDSEQLRYD